MKEQIIALRAEGKTYKEITKILGCEKGLISYHLNPDSHERKKKLGDLYRKSNPLIQKVNKFKKSNYAKVRDFQRNRKDNGEFLLGTDITFTVQDVKNKIGKNNICYLSGRIIDLEDTKNYHFDHIIPASKGGTNSLENLGLACKEANLAKHNMSVEELLILCKDILQHNGYKVIKMEGIAIDSVN